MTGTGGLKRIVVGTIDKGVHVMSLHKENTPACSHTRLAVPDEEQQTSSLRGVELSDQDLQRVVGGDGPSGLQSCRRRNRLGRRSAPGGAGRPGLPTGSGFPWFPGFPRDWSGGDDPGSLSPECEDDLSGFWSLWGWL
jgi:hypothetical protein